MPTYDYRCAACGHALELFHSMSDAPKKKCPACGKSKLERLIGAGAGFLFKGAGFYLTDYRSDSYKAGEKAASDGAKPTAEASDKASNNDSPQANPAGAKAKTATKADAASTSDKPSAPAATAKPGGAAKPRDKGDSSKRS